MQITRLIGRLRLSYLLPLAFAGWLAACSDTPEDSADAVEAALTSDDGILRYIPADTPYVFAALQSVPDDVLDKLAPHIEAIVQTYADLARAGINRPPDEPDEEVLDEATRERITAVIGELATMVTAEGIPEAGIDRNSTAAFYGVGLLPVMRVTLSDAALFESAVEKLEKAAGSKMETASIDGHAYRYAGNDEARLVAAVIGDQLVIAGIPAGLPEPLFKTVLGLTLPQQNIAEGGALARLATKYGFKSYGLGMFDIERIAATFVDPQTGVNAELLSLMDYDMSQLSDVCKSEIRSLASVVPRIVTGYTELTPKRFRSNTAIELRSDIAAGVQTLTAAVPGLGMEQGGLMSFGMSLNLLAAREFYSARLDALEADPFECEHFADFQDGVAKGRALLNQPVPPAAYAFRGFLAVIDDIKGMDLRKQQPPTDIDMRLLVASDNPEALLATGAMFSPEVAALNLKADSQPVELAIPALASTVKAAYVAMSDNALAMSFGDGSEAGLEPMLAAESKQPPPFLSMNMDAGRYYGFIGDAMTFRNTDDEPQEVTQAASDVMKALEGMFSRIAFDIEFTEHGVEMPSALELAD
jgi:hypothetical protein